MLVGHGLSLALMHIVETNLRSKTKLVLNKLLIHFNSYLKQMYINDKIEWFSYKVGVVYVGVHILVSRHLKEELAFAKI